MLGIKYIYLICLLFYHNLQSKCRVNYTFLTRISYFNLMLYPTPQMLRPSQGTVNGVLPSLNDLAVDGT